MAKEIERKFLVADEGWRAGVRSSRAIVQFYLAADADRSVRVRILDGDRAKLTLKFGAGARERDEFEYPLPLEDAQALRAFALGKMIEKTRHIVPWQGRDYEVDIFAGALEGLALAELETPDTVPATELPPWLGREVTDEAAFLNVALALGAPPETP